MPIIKVDSYISAYRIWANAADPHHMSGRGSNIIATQMIARTVLGNLQPVKDLHLIDIGCGDGTLLRMAAPEIRDGVGIAPTVEEQNRLDGGPHPPNVRFLVGLSDSVPMPGGRFERVVMNGVAPLLHDDDAMMKTLAEIKRLAAKDAVIWVGEVPDRNELSGKKYGDSVVLWLVHVLRNQGLGRFTSALANLIAAVFGKPFIIMPKSHYFVSPERFTAFATSAGLEVRATLKHQQPGQDGQMSISPSRYNYILTPK